jgi:hypothetical protein
LKERLVRERERQTEEERDCMTVLPKPFSHDCLTLQCEQVLIISTQQSGANNINRRHVWQTRMAATVQTVRIIQYIPSVVPVSVGRPGPGSGSGIILALGATVLVFAVSTVASEGRGRIEGVERSVGANEGRV